MPAAAAPGKGGIQRGLPPPKLSLPPAPARPSGIFGAVAHAIQSTGRAASQAATYTSKPRTGPPGGGSDALSSGPGYGSAQANSFKQSKAYTHAIIDVFRHQSPAQQKAILQGARQNPNRVESRILLHGSYLTAAPLGSGKGGPLESTASAQLGIKPGLIGKLAQNAATDAWNLPGGTVEGLYGMGKNVLTGHEGAAFHMFVDPFIQLAEHPVKTFEEHPLNSALMLSGAKAIVGRGAGFAARAGLAGDAAKAAASTVRAPLSLGTVAGEAAPIFEERSYSPDVFTKAIQRSREKSMQARGHDPNVARPAPRAMSAGVSQALNVGTDAKLRRISDEMTSVRQMAGRQDRARVLNEMHQARPGPESQNVVSHILQSVIRSPETARADVAQEIRRLKAAQTGKRTPEEIWNRKQVRDLSIALKTPGALEKAFEAAAPLRQLMHTQDAHLVAHGLLDAEQALRRKVLPYAMAHMGVKYDHAQGEFVHPDGAKLPTQDILDHLKANGVPDPAYVGHFPGKVAPWRFYSTYRLARGSLADKKLTGNAFKNGAYDHTWQGLAGQMASRAEAVTKSSLHDKVISRLGIVPSKELLDKFGIKSDNGMLTPAEAQRIAHASRHDDNGNPIPNSLELTPITAGNAKLLDEIRNLQHPTELHNISGVELKALANAVHDAASRTDQTRNVVLVPTTAVQRFGEQFAKTDSTLRSIGKVTQQFRRTVLPYSVHWMMQTGSEAILRSILAGALHPEYLRAGRELTKRLEKDEPGRAASMEMTNATFYNKRDPLAVHNPNPGMISGAAHAFPPTRALIAAHNKYADTIGHAMYGLEHNFRLMGLGKLAHQDVQSFGFSWQNAVKLQGKSIADLAERLKANPALVAKFGRSIDDTFGKYNKFSPKVRAAIQSVAPFLPWYLTAAKYVLWHLPANHPVASALLASLRQTINQDIKDGKKAPLGTWAMQDLARISPFGIFSPDTTKPSLGGFLQGQQLTGAFLPQFEGALYNLAGVNSFGEGPLKGPNGPVKARSAGAGAAAAESLLEAFLPLARYLKVAEEGGKPSFGTSTILDPQPKNEPSQGVANRIFNPFYSFERSKAGGPAYGSSSSSSSGGWGGGSSSGSGGWGSGSSSSGGWG